jgi:hypothetical protein
MVTDFDAIVEVEDLLIDGLQDAEADGHDFGQGAMNVFILTHDAPRVFAAARILLADRSSPELVAAGYRDDADGYAGLWPEGCSGFELR